MNENENVSLGEVIRTQTRIEKKLDSLIEQDLVARLRFMETEHKDMREQLRWYGRWLLGIVGSLIVIGVITYASAGH